MESSDSDSDFFLFCFFFSWSRSATWPSCCHGAAPVNNYQLRQKVHLLYWPVLWHWRLVWWFLVPFLPQLLHSAIRSPGFTKQEADIKKRTAALTTKSPTSPPLVLKTTTLCVENHHPLGPCVENHLFSC